jgi:hypothetical protein
MKSFGNRPVLSASTCLINSRSRERIAGTGPIQNRNVLPK